MAFPQTQKALTTPGENIPELETEITLLKTPEPRSSALHRVALNAFQAVDGRSYWLDARNTASSYALHELAPHERVLDSVRIARAFTAYQHVSLVETIVNSVTPQTGTIIAPNLASLYRDDDVPEHEGQLLFEATLDALATVASTYGIPVLVTDIGRNDSFYTTLTESADRVLECRRTGLGYRFEGDDFETTVYWDDSYWQTTIPYWVELFGTVDQSQASTVSEPMLSPAMEA
jgi:hypothetical protein